MGYSASASSWRSSSEITSASFNKGGYVGYQKPGNDYMYGKVMETSGKLATDRCKVWFIGEGRPLRVQNRYLNPLDGEDARSDQSKAKYHAYKKYCIAQ